MIDVWMAAACAAGVVVTGGICEYRMSNLRRQHEREACEWRERKDVELRTANLCGLLVRAFPKTNQTKALRTTLRDIVRASEALSTINKEMQAMSPESLYILVEHLKIVERQEIVDSEEELDAAQKEK